MSEKVLVFNERYAFEAKGKKYCLKEISENDLEWIYDLMTNKTVREMCFSQKEFSMAEHIAYWKKKLVQKKFKARAIWHENKPVGLVRLDGNDISIAVKPDFWESGIAFNALSQFDLSNFEARVKPGNDSSLRLFKKLGFKEKFVKKKYIQLEKEEKQK